MAVERYITEVPLPSDVSEECSVHWKVKYETYAAGGAETTARIFVAGIRKKLWQSLSVYVSREMYNRKSTPTIDEPIKVMRTQYQHDILESHDGLPIAFTDEN